MIFYLENTSKSTDKLLEIIIKSSKVAQLKIILQKWILFYTPLAMN